VNEVDVSHVYGGSSFPAWKRGSPLAPVVLVVGEGQVNLVATGCSRMRAMVKVSKALWLMIWSFDEPNPSIFRLRHRLSLRLSSPDSQGRATGATGVSVVPPIGPC